MISKKLLLIIGGASVVGITAIGLGLGLGLSQKSLSQEEKAKVDETIKSIKWNESNGFTTNPFASLGTNPFASLGTNPFASLGTNPFATKALKSTLELDYFLNNLPNLEEINKTTLTNLLSFYGLSYLEIHLKPLYEDVIKQPEKYQNPDQQKQAMKQIFGFVENNLEPAWNKFKNAINSKYGKEEKNKTVLESFISEIDGLLKEAKKQIQAIKTSLQIA